MKNNLEINRQKDNEILTGYNFARASDTVFSEILTHDQFTKINNKENLHVVYKNKDLLFYLNSNISLKENHVIFSTTDLVEELFNILKNKINFKNLKLITHQSDISIDKKLFIKKPDCISIWYSTNVNYKDKNLIPIPIGLSNNPAKNPMKDDFKNIFKNEKQENKIYANFQVNTNIKEREKLLKDLVVSDWAVVESPDQKLTTYMDKLNNYKFILCPWGNGFDTHRFWESIYAGSIPITKKHITYESAEGLPVILVDKYSDINKEKLDSFLQNLASNIGNYEKMSMKYWLSMISEIKIDDHDFEDQIRLSENQTNNVIKEFNLNARKDSNRKKLKFKFNQLKKLIKKLFL